MTQMANILGYVQYKYNPEITYTALKILRVLCRRVEHIVALLPPASRAAIVEGCASCLELAFAMVPPGDEEIPLEESASSAVDCATLVFELLHENLERAGANMSHLLLGFDITGASSEIEVSPFTEFNCLSVILELLEAAPPSMHASGRLAVSSTGARGRSFTASGDVQIDGAAHLGSSRAMAAARANLGVV